MRNHYKPKGSVLDMIMTSFFQWAKGTAFLETDEVGLTFQDLGADGKVIIFNI